MITKTNKLIKNIHFKQARFRSLKYQVMLTFLSIMNMIDLTNLIMMTMFSDKMDNDYNIILEDYKTIDNYDFIEADNSKELSLTHYFMSSSDGAHPYNALIGYINVDKVKVVAIDGGNNNIKFIEMAEQQKSFLHV